MMDDEREDDVVEQDEPVYVTTVSLMVGMLGAYEALLFQR